MLDAAQQRIADHLEGGLLVLAPVGTGKTFVLAERVARALESGFDPERILCLTFTNRAAQEVRQRLAQRFPGRIEQLSVHTFHGLCSTILRQEARMIGLPVDFTISDEEDSIDLLRLLGAMNADDARKFYGEIDDCKRTATSAELGWPPRTEHLFQRLGAARSLAARYQGMLAVQHKLDFADLVFQVNCLFKGDLDVRSRWESRFDLVQVDEVQDTHRSEYRVVWVLAHRSRNLALFGDIDQTIYRWRGSDPRAIVEQFRKEFQPVTTLTLELNRRSTRRLLMAARSFADSTGGFQTRIEAHESCCDGEVIPLHRAVDAPSEARWIGQRIQELAERADDFAYQRVGVLTANNSYRRSVAEGLERLGVPHVTVEEFEFFRRQEIKDALAPLRLVLNPADDAAAARLVERVISGTGKASLQRIRKAGESLGLLLADLLRPETFASGDPFGDLLERYRAGSLVVVDVETTGRSARLDEVIEIAATRLNGGRPADSYHSFLQNRIPVDRSAHVHGYSDAYLAEHGRPAAEVLGEFFAFCGDDLIVGHNVSFDLRMMANQARRNDLQRPNWQSADTLQLARRFTDAGNFSLKALAAYLELSSMPAHRAQADVATTCDLLAYLMPRLQKRAAERRDLVARESPPFADLAAQLDGWRCQATDTRPAALLRYVLDDSGLRQHYARESRRLKHLDQLVEIFAARDDPALDAFTALGELVHFAALARNVDHLVDGDDRVRVITIHQAKGLEFEDVFIAGLHDGELPRWRSIQDGRLDEEQRLFYVALTRARRRLFLSYCAESGGRKPNQPSRFFSYLDQALLAPT